MDVINCNILIVDDSAVTRAAIKRTLCLAGMSLSSIFEAGNGHAALEVLENVRVDLVLADLHMPEMDGVEMTSRILANDATKDIPVMVVSAEPSAQRLEQLKQSGVRGYIRKPFTPEQIRRGIADILQPTTMV